MKITLIAGARPNFMKIAPIIHAIQNAVKLGQNLQYRLVHTGQHYDAKMSDTFFEELNIPHPDVNLECGGGSQAEQTASILVAFEKDLIANPTDLVLVVGDVTSTMACAIVAKKMNTKVAHVEAGIRDFFFTTSATANENLKNSGVKEEAIFFVGNVMIDTLLANQSKFRMPAIYASLGLREKEYFVLTMHRPANVDETHKLKEMMTEILSNANGLPVIFPIHPRTAKIIESLNIDATNLHIVEPMGYLEFNYLVQHAKAVVTDSGGITEETTVMHVPCLTLRDNTERPETIIIGTNELVGTNPENIKPALEKLFAGNWKKGGIPNLWDGKTSERIIAVLIEIYG